MIKTISTSQFTLAFLMFCAASAGAQTSLGTAFTYQGRLKDGGSPASGLHDLRFRLYDAAAGGTQISSSVCVNDVSVTDGLFTLALDFGAQFAGQERFLEIEVRTDTGLDCANPAGFVTLAPRQALTGTPNALFALTADKLDGLDSTAFLQSIPVPLTLSGSSTTHIIRGENTATTDGAAAVYGLASGANSLTTYGLLGRSESTSGSGVFGEAPAATGLTCGGRFESASSNGRGVFGLATSASGASYGGRFESFSTTGIGVFGFAAAGSGTTYGVFGMSNSTSGTGVRGVASTTSGATYGGRFESSSTSGSGVFGEAGAATGLTCGGRFESASSNGRGVFGLATSASGASYGGRFESFSTTGLGVFGFAAAGSGTTYGVFGMSNSTSGTGVRGTASAASGVTTGILGECTSPDGVGVRSANAGLGNSFDVDLSGPNGAINTKGFVYREYTTAAPSAAIPIAYGSISATGAINGGTGNFTVTHTVPGEYDITIAGETYSNNTFTVTITPVTNSPRLTGVADSGASFRVNMWNLSGTLVDNAFQFTVWTANPSGPG
ncbi:MAG: hypothetical protein HZB38_12995 [Planctomycetes bacterium]|nr:hypothetical protein [Planctomycetota bacterium]